MRYLFSTPPESGLSPAIFLHRDGVINERVVSGHVRTWAEFKFLRGIEETVAALTSLKLPIIVVSNQACLGKGILDESILGEITRRFVGLSDIEAANAVHCRGILFDPATESPLIIATKVAELLQQRVSLQ
jgi:histidinol phosphatase-like enzyme